MVKWSGVEGAAPLWPAPLNFFWGAVSSRTGGNSNRVWMAIGAPIRSRVCQFGIYAHSAHGVQRHHTEASAKGTYKLNECTTITTTRNKNATGSLQNRVDVRVINVKDANSRCPVSKKSTFSQDVEEFCSVLYYFYAPCTDVTSSCCFFPCSSSTSIGYGDSPSIVASAFGCFCQLWES